MIEARVARWLVAAVLLLTVFTSMPEVPGASAEIPFRGTASSIGVRATVQATGVPLTDTPVDGGGPTAQAELSSSGLSTAYAAFPDPGPFVVQLPGLLAGLLNDPSLPSPPDYPFFVRTSHPTNPEESIGEGPYNLSATSDPSVSQAEASAGLEATAVGNAALVSSTASVAPVDGGVVATATSSVDSVTVGPLTIGRVESTSSMEVDSRGDVTPSSSLKVTGVSVAGLPLLAFTEDQIVVGGVGTPVEVNATLMDLLRPLGITIEVMPAEETDETVIAPALKVTYPYDLPPIPNVGDFEGTATLVLGFSSATMTAAEPISPVDAPTTSTALPPTDVTSPDLDTAGPADASTPPPVPEPDLAAGTPSPARESDARTPVPAPIERLASAVELDLDIRPVYLLISAAALVTLVLTQLFPRSGERKWTHSAG